MNIKTAIASIILLFSVFSLLSQDNLYSSLTIDPELKKNANTVIRLNEVHVTLKSSEEMNINEKVIITILNKEGNKNLDAFVYYDPNRKIGKLQALAFDAYGNEIKKIKKNDFKDVAAVSGGTLYSESRVKYLEYTPIGYPYTIELTYEMITDNTAFIPPFYPVNDYYESVESSSYILNYQTDLSIRKKEKNIGGLDVVNENKDGEIAYRINNFKALKPEDFSPTFSEIVPKVLFASKKFTLEGVNAEVENWNEFGKWVYQDLIKDTHDLPESTIKEVQDLVKSEDDIDKAKKVYQYVQDKTRYISVQIGIGGWKPFNTSEVDRLSYGDCKALTNYTMALLKAVGIESNYTVLYAGESQRNIEKDFASIQGNHAILSIPNGDDTIWLECTSQNIPFGYIGDFTDDRDVIVIGPDGGEIKHTKKYTTEENSQIIYGKAKLMPDESIEVKANIRSRGIQYNDSYILENETDRDLDIYYKNHWDYINNVEIDKVEHINDQDNIEFLENIEFKALNYASMVGERMLFTINILNRNTYVPDRYRNRKLPLKISRGFIDVDEVEIVLPDGYKIESLPGNKVIENKFGKYQASIENKNDSTLIYKRKFVINDGDFPKEDYSAFRTFYKNVSKWDNSKIALIKIQQ